MVMNFSFSLLRPDSRNTHKMAVHYFSECEIKERGGRMLNTC